MPVLGFTQFERLFRGAGGVDVDRDDVKRYLDFVNDAIYDLLTTARATARAQRPRHHRAAGPPGHPRPSGGVPGGTAVVSVVVFRFVTYWLPALPGAVAIRELRRRRLL
jgi:hypothetical protein